MSQLALQTITHINHMFLLRSTPGRNLHRLGVVSISDIGTTFPISGPQIQYSANIGRLSSQYKLRYHINICKILSISRPRFSILVDYRYSTLFQYFPPMSQQYWQIVFDIKPTNLTIGILSRIDIEPSYLNIHRLSISMVHST